MKAIRRDGTPMPEEERLRKEAAFAKIKEEMWESYYQKFPSKRPKEAEIVEFPKKLSEWELIRR